MSTKKKIFSKVSCKTYECLRCGNKVKKQTNHFGEIYPFCFYCQSQVPHKCLDPIPKDMKVPKPWKMAKIGDICGISSL